MQSLPIDSVLDHIVAELRRNPSVIVEAPPGSGKSTRVPLALLEAGLAGDGEIVVTEPRRLAARLTAAHVATLLGESVGGRVGYTVRFENKTGPGTRIRYATEGVVVRQLLGEPSAARIRVLVLDEFHERHLESDLLLALVRRLQRTDPRPPKLVVMSATLDSAALRRYLDDCPRVQAAGRVHPLTIDHVTEPDDRPLEKQVASAVRRMLGNAPPGDVLVFLPGAREIALAASALEKLTHDRGFELRPLHGDLPLSEQALAVNPSAKRKVILSTNVAESSVTIDGVTAVIDSGLARVASHSPWSGLPTLTVRKISRASAKQRAGRAGRTQPGHVLRLFTAGDLQARPEHERPELQRLDLTEIVLALAGAGLEFDALPWLDAPPDVSLIAARELLSRLAAMDSAGQITAIGRRMRQFPIPPRLARVVVRGEELGVGEPAALAAALLGERDIRLEARTRPGLASGPTGPSGPSDVLELMDRFEEGERAGREAHRLRRAGLDARAMQAVRQSMARLRQLVRDPAPVGTTAEIERGVLRSILAGFPDRVAKRQRRDTRQLVLASGKTAFLSETSVVQGSLLVALDAEERGRRIVVRLASEVDAQWLLEDHEGFVKLESELVLNGGSGQVEALSRMAYGSVVLEEERAPALPSEAVSRLLSQEALVRFDRDSSASEWLCRLELLRAHTPSVNVPAIDRALVQSTIEDRCVGVTSLQELDAVDWGAELVHRLGPEVDAALRRETPATVTLPGGRTVAVHYEPGKPPWVASRLQDFFGMAQGPAVCNGKVALVLHLLAPNGRAVQVTTDLAGFWERHYPALRRELGRRYPKHAWPEDGRTASPPSPRRARR